jgi:hypothetical protein
MKGKKHNSEISNLNGIIGANVVLVNGLQPSDVVVGVRDQMNIELAGNNARRRIVHHVLGLRA